MKKNKKLEKKVKELEKEVKSLRKTLFSYISANIMKSPL